MANPDLYDEVRDNPAAHRADDDAPLMALAHGTQYDLPALDVCACGHTRHSHESSGRCRAQRHRCRCRAFVAQRTSLRNR